MSGHNKWSTIKHKKGAADAKRGKLFTKLIREVTVSARAGGGDLSGNPRLRAAVSAARVANMPGDNIDRAIKRGTGELEGVEYEEVTYEGYGPAGVAVLVESMTDNRNRTVSDVRHLFAKGNGNMGEAGCVSWMFSRVGVIVLPAAGVDEDALMELALELGADDVKQEDGSFEVQCSYSDVDLVAEKLREAGYESESARVVMLPQSTVKIAGRDAEVMLRLLENLEDHDDVQNVWSNFDIDDEELARLAGAVSLIVGIDPGTRATGYAVLRGQGRRLDLVASGTIRLDPKADLHTRLGTLQQRLEEIMQREGCSVVAVEDIFNHRNTRSALSLGHARGVALAVAARRGLDVCAYPPASVKQAVAGHGRADKRQIQQMVRVLLGLTRTPAQDEADAIAVAICHAMSGRAVQAPAAGAARSTVSHGGRR